MKRISNLHSMVMEMSAGVRIGPRRDVPVRSTSSAKHRIQSLDDITNGQESSSSFRSTYDDDGHKDLLKVDDASMRI